MKKLCIRIKRNINSGNCEIIITSPGGFVKENCGSLGCRNRPVQLLLAEGHAVGALVHSGIHLVGTHQDLVQRAVVFVLTMVGALLDSAFDALVCVTIHSNSLL